LTKPIIEVKGVTKVFPGVKALDDVSFDVLPGEVHVLIGENGAGKSTLVNILLGSYPPTEGVMYLDGEAISFQSPSEALRHGIGGVNQELMAVPWLSVGQNIFLNREPRKPGLLKLIDFGKMHKDSAEILASMDVHIDTRLPIKKAEAATRQMVEIARVLVTDPKIIVLDEPTAILSDKEVELLFAHIRALREKGASIIYISHRLQEIRQIADRVTVLRDGKKVATVGIDEAGDDELVKMMVGRNIDKMYPRNRRAPGKEVLRLVGCSVKDGPEDIDLVVREGEIVGLAGLVGAGRTELARAVFGVDSFEAGEMYLYGEKIEAQTPSRMIASRVALLPEERKQLGAALKLSVAFNVLMASFKQVFGFVYRRKAAEAIAARRVEELRIVTPSVRQLVYQLSGGNQQKVVLSKWLQTESKFLIFDEPTRGIDVGAKVEIHTLMDKLVADNAAILMISSDLPEVLGMSDRIYVMYHGRFVGRFNHDEADPNKVAALMLGAEKGTTDEQ
jgi:ribose transport system ATP-binding protein